MKANEQTQPRPCPCQCCGANPGTAAAGGADQSGQIPAPPGYGVNWTENLRPFLGVYVFKG
jgi:hypothetical protein